MDEVLFLVEPVPPTHDLLEVLEAAMAATARFELVDEMGVEHPGEWALLGVSGTDSVGPKLLGGGVVVGAFAKDEVTRPQATTIREVLLDELRNRGLECRVSAAPAGTVADDLPDARPAAPERSRPQQEQEAKRWFVQRGVRTRTTTGKPYVDLDWLRADGTWTRDHELARSWPNDRESMIEMGALVVRLREQADAAPDPRFGEVTGVLLTPGLGNPGFPRPPVEIRDPGPSDHESS